MTVSSQAVRERIAWALLVLAAHTALLAWSYRQGDEALPERLAVRLTQLARPVAPPPASPRRKQLAALPSPSVQPALPPPPLLEPLPPLEALSTAPPEPLTYEAGAEWPLSTRLDYWVEGHFRGPVHGDAEVEWLRQGERYQLRLRLGLGPRALPFAARELLSEGRVTAQGLQPQRYDEQTRIGFGEPRRLQLRMHEGLLRLAGGRQLAAPTGLQDSASQFGQLAWLLHTGQVPLLPGQVIELPLALPHSLRPWRYEIVGPELAATPLGEATALWHLRPLPPLPPGALAAEVWLAPALSFLPLRLRISDGGDTWLLLQLRETPLQEAAPQNPAPLSEPNPP